MINVKALGKYVYLGEISFRSKVAYPMAVLIRTLLFVLMLYLFAQIWGGLLNSDENIGGLSRRQLIWYLMLTQSIMFSSAHINRKVEDEVKSGGIAYTLVRPIHFVWYHFSTYAGETLGLLLFNLTVGIVAATCLVGLPSIDVHAILMVGISMVLAFILQFLIRMSLALLAFWVEDTGPFFLIYSKLLFTIGGLFIPLDLYPDILRKASEILPFSYMLYAPAKLFVSFGFADFFHVLRMQLGWLVCFTMLTLSIYKKGVKHINVNGG